MTWTDFYLVCFLVGFLLSLVSLIIGHWNLHFHLPHGNVQGLHIHWGNGGVHGGIHAGAHGAVHGAAGHGTASGHPDGEVSPINFATIAAFLAWFGGSGYLLTTYSTFWHVVAFAIAVLFGLAGAATVFWVLGRLVSREENLDPADYEMIGVLGRVVSGIREQGTGEIVYVQGGTRHTAAARSEDRSAIPRDTEVVVTRYDKGIAYVRRWEEMAAEGTSSMGQIDTR
jgi:membrane protein implicated in regulation of membrane protease activity